MDNPLSVPRLRINRHTPRLAATHDKTGAGHLRLPYDVKNSDFTDEEDAEATPKATSRPPLGTGKNSPMTTLLSGDTPAARLRTAIALSGPSGSSRASSLRPPPEDQSDDDSDFEAPNMTSQAEPSMAQESLKQLLAHALREPGGTPQKRARPRRNSIDASEVEDLEEGFSLRYERVERERAKYRGKRKSMSDEEAEKLTKSISKHDSPYRTSPAAATYDALRQRLAQSRSTAFQPSSDHTFRRNPALDVSDVSFSDMEELAGKPSTDDSADTARIVKDLDPANPQPASTTAGTINIPSQLQSRSNLLDQDSDMHNAMKGVDSFVEGDTIKTQRKMPFSSSRASPRAPIRSESHSERHAHAKSHTVHNIPVPRRSSEEKSDPASSRMVAAPEYERERMWNQPKPHQTTPERHQHLRTRGSYQDLGRGSPSNLDQPRSRRLSGASMRSFDDGSSSVGGSSVGSRSEYRERLREMEEERNKERERMWNKPLRTQRSTSSLSQHSPHERSRTYSGPMRSDSALSYLSPDYRRHSYNSMSSSGSRPGSPASSIGSVDRDGQDHHEDLVEREKERNWNSPQPKWKHWKPPPQKSFSPVRSPSGSFTRSPNGSMTFRPPGSDPRPRVPSTVSSPTNMSGRARAMSLTNKDSKREVRPLVRAGTDSKISREATSRENSRTPSPALELSDEITKSPGYRSRYGWTFPRNRYSLPPLDHEEEEEPELPEPISFDSRPSSRLSAFNTNKPSSIPIRSHHIGGGDMLTSTPASSKINGDAENRKGHKRTFIELSQSIGSIKPLDSVDSAESIDDDDEPFEAINLEGDQEPSQVEVEDNVEVDAEADADNVAGGESDAESQLTSTPIAKPSSLPEVSITPGTPPPSASTLPPHEEDPNGDADAWVELTPPSTPPRDPSTIEPQSFHSLETPPRFPSFSSQKFDLMTPSPPRNMPELPGPPSSSEEDTDAEIETEKTPINVSSNLLANFTAMKTPKPPGAWATTPVPEQKIAPPMEDSIVVGEASSTADFVDVTPVQTQPPDGLPVQTPVGQTPAPPGAYVPTPVASGGSARRRSILKVRFDVDPNISDTSLPEIPIIGPPLSPERDKNSISEIFPTVNIQPTASGSGVQSRPEPNGDTGSKLPDRSTTPPIRSRTPPRSPGGVRVLDAYGRETSDSATELPESKPVVKEEPVSESSKVVSTTPSRSRNPLRIVDAMGREVTDEESAPVLAQDKGKARHRDPLARLRDAVAGLAQDMSEDELFYAVATPSKDPVRRALNNQEEVAERLQRNKAMRDDLRAKYGAIQESIAKHKLKPLSITVRSRSFDFLNTWVLWSFLLLQIFLLVYMYRYSTLRAKHIFLTTYYDYDSSSPDRFLDITHADTPHFTIPPPSWSIATVSDTFKHSGWRGVVSEAWGNVTYIMSAWQTELWEAFGPQERKRIWPPV